MLRIGSVDGDISLDLEGHGERRLPFGQEVFSKIRGRGVLAKKAK
jgi:hypothetical protein